MANDQHISIPVLGYHHVFPEDAAVSGWIRKTPFSLTPEVFRAQMAAIAELGLSPLTTREVDACLAHPENPAYQKKCRHGILITFDDGWATNIEYALPILQAYNLTATFFVISGAIGHPEYMTWAQLETLQQAGMDIQSHTHLHRSLGLLSEDEIRTELQSSREMIESKLQTAVESMSFPNGSYDRRVLNIAADIYQSAYTSNIGLLAKDTSKWERPRLIVRREHTQEIVKQFCNRDIAPLRGKMALQTVKKSLMKAIGFRNYMRLHSLIYQTPIHEMETESDYTQ